jgi:hypothetical protein
MVMASLLVKMMAKHGMCHPKPLEGCVSTFGRVVVCQPSIVRSF